VYVLCTDKVLDLRIALPNQCKWLKAMLHGAIFLATCNAILLLRDVN
jgi:hypothetical protein